jgi:hypothetical protein
MLVSGLVFNLSPGLAGQAAFEQLQRNPALMLGARTGNLLPASLVTEDVKQSRDFHDQMSATPGVEYVDVVYVGFEEHDVTQTAQPALREFSTADSAIGDTAGRTATATTLSN